MPRLLVSHPVIVAGTLTLTLMDNMYYPVNPEKVGARGSGYCFKVAYTSEEFTLYLRNAFWK